MRRDGIDSTVLSSRFEIDWEVQALIFDAIKRIENAIDYKWRKSLRSNNFGRNSLKYIDLLPAYVANEIRRSADGEIRSLDKVKLNFGSVKSILMSEIRSGNRKYYCSIFGLEMASNKSIDFIFSHLNKIRNQCAHVQNTISKIEDNNFFCIQEYDSGDHRGEGIIMLKVGNEEIKFDLKKIYGTLSILNYMLSHIPRDVIPLDFNKWHNRIQSLLRELHTCSFDLKDLGFPTDWKASTLWKETPLKTRDEIATEHGYGDPKYLTEATLSDSEKKEWVARSFEFANRIVNEGWDHRMDNHILTARNLIMRSITGMEDEGHGLPKSHHNLARALAHKTDKSLLEAYNDYYARRTFNDPCYMDVEKGMTDDQIFNLLKRWMILDNERRESGYDRSIVLICYLTRTIERGEEICMHDIQISTGAPLENNDIYLKEDPFQFIKACMSRWEEIQGRAKIIDQSFDPDMPWPSRVVLDLNSANHKFKLMVEEDYRLSNPDIVENGGTYCAPFILPLFPVEEVSDRCKVV